MRCPENKPDAANPAVALWLTSKNQWCRVARHSIVISAFATIAFLGGCATSNDRSDAEYRQRLALYKDTPVPLPSTTPFDSDAAARAMYLDWYRDGYRSGLTGVTITCCFPPGPHPQAQQKGWSDGQLQGGIADIYRRFPSAFSDTAK